MKYWLHVLLSMLAILTLSVFPTTAQSTEFFVDINVDGCIVAIAFDSSNNSRDYNVSIQLSYGDTGLITYFGEDIFFPTTLLLSLSYSYTGTVLVYYEVVDFFWDEEEVWVDCSVDVTAPATTSLPCGPALVGVSQGLLVRATPLYWAPRQDAASNVVLQTTPDAKTYWVLGMDSTRSFYKIVIACKTYWVPVDTLAPNPDDVWRGTPLPTQIVN